MPPLLVEDSHSLPALQERLAAYEARTRLSYEEFRTYVAFEIECENRLLAQSESARQMLDYETTLSCLEAVRSLNDSLRQIAARELERDGPEPDEIYRTELIRWRDEAEGLLYYVEADGLLVQSTERRLNNDLEGAMNACQQSYAGFLELARSRLPNAPVSLLKAQICEYTIELYRGLNSLAMAEYDAGVNQFREALVDVEQVLDQVQADASASDTEPNVREILGVLRSDQAVITALRDLANFHRELQNASYREAARIGEAMTRMHEAALHEGESAMPAAMVLIRRMDYEHLAGWRDYAKAQLAIEQRRWGESRDLLDEAKEHWEAARQTGIRSRVPVGEVIRSQGGMFDLLIRGARYRCDREEQNDQVMRRLEQELVDARAALGRSINIQGGATVTQGDNINFRGDVGIVGAAGSGATGNVNVGEQKVGASADVKALVDELRRLQRTLEQAAATDQEQQAAQEIGAAVTAAEHNDENGLLDHLRNAGRWALSTAGAIGVELAKAKLTQALGLP
jgi:hypothetical protein